MRILIVAVLLVPLAQAEAGKAAGVVGDSTRDLPAPKLTSPSNRARLTALHPHLDWESVMTGSRSVPHDRKPYNQVSGRAGCSRYDSDRDGDEGRRPGPRRNTTST